MSAAFDYIDHLILLQRLQVATGIGDTTLGTLRSTGDPNFIVFMFFAAIRTSLERFVTLGEVPRVLTNITIDWS